MPSVHAVRRVCAVCAPGLGELAVAWRPTCRDAHKSQQEDRRHTHSMTLVRAREEHLRPGPSLRGGLAEHRWAWSRRVGLPCDSPAHRPPEGTWAPRRYTPLMSRRPQRGRGDLLGLTAQASTCPSLRLDLLPPPQQTGLTHTFLLGVKPPGLIQNKVAGGRSLLDPPRFGTRNEGILWRGRLWAASTGLHGG